MSHSQKLHLKLQIKGEDVDGNSMPPLQRRLGHSETATAPSNIPEDCQLDFPSTENDKSVTPNGNYFIKAWAHWLLVF